jgi:hypothetical protein
MEPETRVRLMFISAVGLLAVSALFFALEYSRNSRWSMMGMACLVGGAYFAVAALVVRRKSGR